MRRKERGGWLKSELCSGSRVVAVIVHQPEARRPPFTARGGRYAHREIETREILRLRLACRACGVRCCAVIGVVITRRARDSENIPVVARCVTQVSRRRPTQNNQSAEHY
jgi:hypothetical protein